MQHLRHFIVALLGLLALAAGSSCSISSTSWSINGFRSDQERHVRVVEQLLEIRPGDTVDAASPFGAIQVVVAEQDFGVRAEITGFADTGDEARLLAEAADLEVVRDGSALRLRVVRRDGEELEQVGVRFDLTVPAGTGLVAAGVSGEIAARGALADVRAESGFGAVTVAGARGRVAVETASGAVVLEDIEGPGVEATSGFGGVRLEHCRVETCALRTSSGQIQVDDVEAASFVLDSGFGALTVSGCRGDLQAETSSGSITVDGHHGDRLDLHSGFGGIRARGVFQQVAIDSSSGAIAFRAEPGSAVAVPWRLESGFGAVQARIPADLAADVDLSSGFGSVRSDLPLTLSRGTVDGRSDAAEGLLNAGGQRLVLRSSSGTVTLLAD